MLHLQLMELMYQEVLTQLDDLFDGFTLNLSSTTTSAFRVKATLDKNTSLETLREFVNSINTARDKINELTSNEIIVKKDLSIIMSL